MCFAFAEPKYEVDDNLAIIKRQTAKSDDKVQAFLDGLNGNEMERLLEMLKKKLHYNRVILLCIISRNAYHFLHLTIFQNFTFLLQTYVSFWETNTKTQKFHYKIEKSDQKILFLYPIPNNSIIWIP